MTSKMWMKPPSVYELTMPSAHRISRITKIVHNIVTSLDGLERAPHRVTFECPPSRTLCVQGNAGSVPGRSRRDPSTARGERVVEDRDLRVRFGDLVGQGHPQRLAERHQRALEELVVVGREG